MAEEITDETTEELTVTYEMGHMGGLAAELVLLFAQAADLPDPQSAVVYGILGGFVHDEVSLQFAPREDSAQALAIWATAFGAVIECSTEARKDGPERWIKATFPYMHLTVVAFAHIPIPHADYPHQPGRLYDCPACEAACHCTQGDAECVYSGPHNGLAAS